jgi:anti-sigma B factor antagonist
VTILEVHTEQRDELVRVALAGELDLSTTSQVEEELRHVEAAKPELIVLDLSGLSFLDSTGLRLVITADARARDAGRRLALVKGPETVNRVFTITKVDERLQLVDGLDELESR